MTATERDASLRTDSDWRLQAFRLGFSHALDGKAKNYSGPYWVNDYLEGYEKAQAIRASSQS